MRMPTPAKKAASKRMQAAYLNREKAKQEYIDAIQACVDAGLSNTYIASLCGVSEVAIRMYRKRHGIKMRDE